MHAFSTLRPVEIMTRLAATSDHGRERVSIFCPACDRLRGNAFDSLVLLPIHDANGRLLSELRNRIARPNQLFAGVLALDPFRRHADILKVIETSGCSGIANFPSITAIDGEMRVSLEGFGCGATTEINLLRSAVAKGFSALAVVDSLGMAQEAVTIGVSGLIAARHANDSMFADLSKLAQETRLGLLRLPSAVGAPDLACSDNPHNGHSAAYEEKPA